tara:strand:- start:2484 stop:3308 length:825 start_codon:yes stop_codon:yes gene_type:complete
MKETKNKENREYWKVEEENIIKDWCDKALCYQWLHSRCREIYQVKNAWFTIPVIIISTITGTANFAQDRFPDDKRHYFVMAIGSLSIIAGIITTIYQFLQISELNEGYRAAAISWNKLYNNLKTLLSRHPLDRIEPTQAIKLYKDEYEHLCEISPPIIKKVLKNFNIKFKKNDNLIKPEICSKLETTNIYSMSDIERESMINKITNKKKNTKIMDTFFNLNGRNASDEEIDILQNNINIGDVSTNNVLSINDMIVEDNNNEDNLGGNNSNVTDI